MTVIVKSKTDLVVPRSVRRRAGIRAGDQIEFKVSGRVINIIPKLPSADDEYTSDERRVIDARLAESDEDLKAGRSFGPFDTAEAMIASMKAEMKKRPAGAKSKRLK
jgi:bifunctional DNA-binding transcriptional regulator/antitoxin component of YhaV-PrlF toxin-antitoxin module